MNSSTNKIERREFLIRLSLFASSAAVPVLLPGRAIAAGANMSELSASAAVEAMRNGDIKAEDYARALLDRAQGLAHLKGTNDLVFKLILQQLTDIRTIGDPRQTIADQRHEAIMTQFEKLLSRSAEN
jgi:hypothetical protein